MRGMPLNIIKNYYGGFYFKFLLRNVPTHPAFTMTGTTHPPRKAGEFGCQWEAAAALVVDPA